MSTAEIILAAACFAIAAGLAVLAVRHFLQKGKLLNNAWLYASEEERRTMDKAPWYRQSAVVFTLLSAVFVLIGISLLTRTRKLQLLEIPLFAAVILYAVLSTIRIKKQ